jgi:hypothetical protein
MAEAITFFSLAALAVLVIALTHLSVWLGRRETTSDEEQDQRREQERHRSRESYKTATDAIAARLDAITDELYARQRQDQKQERGRTFLSATTIVLAGITAGGALVTAWIFQGQLNVMQAERRPWIQLSEVAPWLLHVDVGAGFVDIPVELRVKNIGLSPAEGVFATGKVYPRLAIDDERRAAEGACKDATTDRKLLAFQGSIVFPNEERPMQFSPDILMIRDIEKARRSEAALQYAGRLASLGKEKADEMLREDLARPLRSTFVIVGCVTYSYHNEHAVGQTSFIIDVAARCIVGPPPPTCTFNVSHSAEYKADDMAITEVRRSLFAR